MKKCVRNRPVFHIRSLKLEPLLNISKARIKWNFRTEVAVTKSSNLTGEETEVQSSCIISLRFSIQLVDVAAEPRVPDVLSL